MTRYTFDNDARNLVSNTGEKIPLRRNQNGTFDGVFLDILEPMEEEGICRMVKIKVFYPNGDIVSGSIMGHLIKLTSKDDLFDGRFNSTQNN